MRRNSKLKTTHSVKLGTDLRPKGSGDFSLKGYNYLGPGNIVDEFYPTDMDDAIAKRHDRAYQNIIDSGQDPYWKYSNADEDARQKFGYGPAGWAAKAFFTVKKAVAPHIDEEKLHNLRM